MRNQGIGSWVERRKTKSKNHVALVFRGDEITYENLASRINSIAHGLRRMGISSGDRVGYLGENHPSFLEMMFATNQLGAIFVPINTRLAGPEIEFIVSDCEMKILVTSLELEELGKSATEGLATKVPIFVVSPKDLAPENSYLQLSKSGESTFIDVDVDQDQTALILYTSGTTGRPKGAMLSHKNLMWNAFNVLVDYDVASDERALLISPMFHAAALGMGVMPILLKGATLVLESNFDPEKVLRLIPELGITFMSGVPTTYKMLYEHENWETTDLSSIRTLTCGGSPASLKVIEAYEKRGLAFTAGYGLTEASPGVSSLQSAHSKSKIGSAGLPHFFVDFRLRHTDELETLDKETGEIEIRGNNVTSGYWNRPETNSELFTEDGWFKTGDIAQRDEEGFIFITDRIKDLIISGGENIYPAEVESLILEIEGVSDVAVVGVPDPKWGEVPWASVIVRAGYNIDLALIQSHLNGKLAKYKIPKRVVVVETLPRTASGKVKKNIVRASLTVIAAAELEGLA
jgi:fatty-acyl-CoA synthase